MSVLVSGPRRVFLMPVLWKRRTGACLGCPRGLHLLGLEPDVERRRA